MLENVLSEYLIQSVEEFPVYPLGLFPTPCHRLDSLSRTYGVEAYCKRDDLTGFGFGGNKARKLELLIPEALEHRADTLVTAGGIQSNFCRMTAAAGAKAGMEVHLVLGGDPGRKPTGNLILDQILGARLRHVDSADWKDWETESERLEEELTRAGKRVFRIPIGGSVPTGAVGYVRAFLEIMKDQERLGVAFDRIIHASGSGGTQAGLVVGKAMTGWPGRITGVSAGPGKQELEGTVHRLASLTAGMLGGRVERKTVSVEDRFVGAAYAARTREGKEAIAAFARQEGIFLDHVYTGKAAAALINRLQSGDLSGETVLFLHTGGQPELFA